MMMLRYAPLRLLLDAMPLRPPAAFRHADAAAAYGEERTLALRVRWRALIGGVTAVFDIAAG